MLTDVTEEIEDMGREASKNAKEQRQRELLDAAIALTTELGKFKDDTTKYISKTDAESILMTQGITRRQARELLTSYDVNTFPNEGRWRLQPVPNARGKPIGVYKV
jgi:hypothetical protein